MNRRFISLLVVVMTAVLVALLVNARQTAASAWTQKVDQWVLDKTADNGEAEFLVYLKEQADLSGAYLLKTKTEKGQYVYEQLTAVANRTQPAVTAVLDGLGVEYRPYWVANMIWVKGDASIVRAMAEHNSVAHIYANPTVPLQEVAPLDEAELVEKAMAVEWNIAHVNADDVWAEGYTGQGVVIGAQDTGYDWDHPALIDQYRGWNGTTADHNYNWHDSIHSGGGVCGADSPQPCDDHGHGTHTLGTMLGDDGGTNQIGMAPGARWIACRNMDVGNGTPATYSECYQWFIAPTDIAGGNPDPTKAPHVIGNSWGCPASEGCNANSLLAIVQAVNAAGIVTVHSAGNEGSSCSTVQTPAGIYDESFTVGATNSTDNIAGFSSRGPVTVDGSNRMKPDISAPGVNIRSSYPGGGYQAGWQGTSMASPHVTGLVALLISADPSLAGQVDTLEYIITQTAVPRTTSQGCGGDGPTDVPNNVYGWGRIDALAAYNGTIHSIDLEKTASADLVVPGDLITYTLAITHNHLYTPTTNVVLTDTIPTNSSFVSATQPYSLNGNVITWDMSQMAADESLSFELVVQVDELATSAIVNSDYGVQSDEVAFVAGTAVTTQVESFALVIEKSASADEVTSGDLLTYTLTVSNLNSIAPLTNLVLTDTLPTGTTFITATGSYTMTGNTLQWEATNLAAGSSWTVELVVQVTLSEGTVENIAYGVESDQVSAVSGPPIPTTVLPIPTPDLYIYLPIMINP